MVPDSEKLVTERALEILRDCGGEIGLREFCGAIFNAKPHMLGFGVEPEDVIDQLEAFQFVAVDHSKWRITLLPSGRNYLA